MILREGEGLTIHLKALRLGELIESLEDVNRVKRREEEAEVTFDFGYFSPTTVQAWRWDYSHLSVGYGEGNGPSIDAFLAQLKASVGKVFEGWKGGSYRMDEKSFLWVANSGEASHTAIWSITPHSSGVRLNTFWLEDY